MSETSKESKRNLILEAAFNLFISNGYASTKIVDIAAKAGIGKGTFYEYFKSKEGVLFELITKRLRLEFEELPLLIGKEKTLRGKLEAFMSFETNFAAHYGRYAVELKQPLTDVSGVPSLPYEITAAILELIGAEYAAVDDIVDFGQSSGEIVSKNKNLITHFIVTSVTSFIMLKNDVPQQLGAPLPETSSHFADSSADDVIDLIINGITA